MNVCGQVIYDKGRALVERNALEERRLQDNYGFIYERPNPIAQVVGRYNINRRQKLTIKVYRRTAGPSSRSRDILADRPHDH